MNTLNLGSDDEPVVKKKSNTRNLKIALGLAAVILIPTIGSTLAGTISVGTGNQVEFAQGFVGTTACDESIDISPRSTVDPMTGIFYLDTITISEAEAPACQDKVFSIRVADAFGTLQIIGNASTVCRFQFSQSGSTTPLTSGGGCEVSLSDTEGFTFSPYIGSPIEASTVAVISIESSNL